MKKYSTIFVILAALLLSFTVKVSADIVSPYAVDFNAEISTTNHDFKAAPGWKHIVSSYGSYIQYYPTYTYLASGGVDDSGCLKVGTQTSVGSGYNTGATTDLLVTPAVDGAISIYVKKDKASGNIKFYNVTEEDGTLTRGEEIEYVAELSTEDFVKVNLPVITDGKKMIGIWVSDATIDNFAADGADVILTPSLKINSVTNTGSTTVDCDENGNFAVSYSVVIENDGEVNLTPGMTNYSLSIINFSVNNAVVATENIQDALAVGESTTVSISATVNVADYPGRNRYDVREDIGGTSKYGAWIEPVAYEPVFTLRYDDSPQTSGFAVGYGMNTEPKSRTFTIRNDGAAPLEITGITLPTGYTTDLVAATIAAHATKNFTITLGNETPGVKAGDAVISYNGGTFTIALSGTVLDPDKMFYDFEDGQIPTGCFIENPSNWEVSNGSSQTVSSENKRYLQSTLRTLSKFVTPLVKVDEGEAMSFDVGMRTGSAASDILLNVYYSPDRENWTLVKTIPSSELPTTRKNNTYAYDMKTYVVEDIPAGNNYIAFEAGYVNVDNVYGFEIVPVAHDVVLASSDLPTTVVRNNDYTATAKLNNVAGVAEAADSYTATLYFNGVAVATAEAPEIAAAGTANFTFSFVPTETGTFPAKVQFDFSDDYTVESDEVNVTVSEELATKEVVAGVHSSSNATSPLALNYMQSETESVYTAEQLGLSAGDKILSLKWKGYNQRNDHTTHVTIWIGNTSDTEVPTTFTGITALNTDAEGMVQVYDGDYTFAMGGYSSQMVDMLTINLAEPFTYTGESLRVIVKSVADNFVYMGFDVTNISSGQCYGRQRDGDISGASFGTRYLPVLYMGVESTPAKVMGVVLDADNNPVEGVTITLTGKAVPVVDDGDGAPMRAATAGDVVYTGTTDANGEYAIDIIQSENRIYDATFSKQGYKDYTAEGIDLANGDVQMPNVVLEADTPTGVEDINAKTVKTGNVYTIDGRLVRRNAENLEGLDAGIYIFNGKKILVK